MADQGITRKVIFQARCDRSCLGWRGPERDAKFVASYDLAQHNVDRHGGAERMGALE